MPSLPPPKYSYSHVASQARSGGGASLAPSGVSKPYLLRTALGNAAAAANQNPSKPSATRASVQPSQTNSQSTRVGPPATYAQSVGAWSAATSQLGKRQAVTTPYQYNNGAQPAQQQPAQQQSTQPSDPKKPSCVLGQYYRRDFRHGHIITSPFHRPNMDPNIDESDPHLTFTVVGPAYAKRRYFVIMFMYDRDMVCLPLYTFNKAGLKAKNDHIKNEYVCMKNVGDFNFVNQGIYPEVEAHCDTPLDPNCTVGLAGCHVVSPREDISILGRMPYKSYQKLRYLWQDLNDIGLQEKWRDS